MDIANLFESHRKHFREEIGYLTDQDNVEERDLLHAHDRATTKTLLDLHRTSAQTAQDQAKPPRAASRKGPKAGSKEARERAQRAAQTRRKRQEDEAAARQEAESAAGGA